MFHLQDNVYFERVNGGVRIVVRDGVNADAPIIKDVTTDFGGFASVFASMSARGEDFDSWREALNELTGENLKARLAELSGLAPCDFPRRNRADCFTAAETKIRSAMLLVESMGADERLTKAVALLGEARDAVADYVDGQLPCANPGVVKHGGPGSDEPHPFRR